MIITVLISIILFGIIIFIHELGHFLMARRFNVTVDEFSIGMGPKLFSRRASSGTAYSLRLLPVGGYVNLAGEDDYSNDPNAINNKPKFQRFLILVSGALMNILLGLLMMLLCVSFSQNLYSNTIESFLVVTPDNSFVTEYNGLQIGDTIIKINDNHINVRYDYVFAAMRAKGNENTITVLRNGKRTVIEDFAFPTTVQNGMEIGNPSFFVPAVKSKNILTVLHDTVFQTFSVVKMVIYSVFDIISGNFSPQAVSGPVGVVSEIHETARIGLLPLLFLMSMITINIGVFNLLPFPALDGGRIFFLLIELIMGRPMNRKVESYINITGLAILFTIMILITFKDIFSLFG